MIKSLNNRLTLLLILTVLGFFVCFFKITQYPPQLNHDEISMLYDISSIAQTHRDIYGNYLPLAFPSTGDFKPGHYIYLSLIPYSIFGDQILTVKFWGALSGALIIPLVFLLMERLSLNRLMAFCGAVMVAFSPAEIFYSRKSFENVVGIALLLGGLILALKIQESEKLWIKILCPLLLAAAMYIYTAHTMVVPLLIVSYIYIFRDKLRPFKKNVLPLIIWAVIIIPLIFLTLFNSGLRFRASSVFITNDLNLGTELSYLPNTNPILDKLLQLRTMAEFITNKYLNHLNPSFIFGNGLALTNQGPVDIGPLLLIELPFFIWGLIYLIKLKKFRQEKILFFTLTALSLIPSALTFESLSPHRTILFYLLLSTISGFGVYDFLTWLWIKKDLIKFPMLAVLTVLLVFNLTYFIHIYTVNWIAERPFDFHYPFQDVSRYIWSQYGNYDTIIFDQTYGEVTPIRGVAGQYILSYYGHLPPAEAQKDLQSSPPGEMKFGKIIIKKIEWRDVKDMKNTLVVGSDWEIPLKDIDQSKIIKTFYFPDKEAAFYGVKL